MTAEIEPSTLRVEPLPLDNSYRNICYLVIDTATSEAVAVDPLDADRVLAVAKSNQWRITKILNTHEHWDHTGGNKALKEKTGARILIPWRAEGTIPDHDGTIADDAEVRIGRGVLTARYMPGHTLAHLCFSGRDSIEPFLICGDTLFAAGVGNCTHGGHPGILYETYRDFVFSLPEETRLYPGHDYVERNLEFTLAIEPGNSAAAELLKMASIRLPSEPVFTTIKMEQDINTFFRLGNEQVRRNLFGSVESATRSLSEREVFLTLRERRNAW